PERAAGLSALAAVPGHLGRYLLPDLVPQATAFRRGEGLQLQAAVPAHHGDPGRLILHDADLDLYALTGRDQQAAEVDPLLVGDGLTRIPRAGLPGRRDGPTRAGLPPARLVPGLVSVGALAAEPCPPSPCPLVCRLVGFLTGPGSRLTSRCPRGGLPGGMTAGGPEATAAARRARQRL